MTVVPAIEEIINSRFPVVIQPQSIPHICIFCNSARDPDGFVDSRQNFDFYGVIYICATCVIAMARNLGMTNREDHQKLVDKIKELKAQYENLLTINNGLRKVIDGLRDSNSDAKRIDTADIDHLLHPPTEDAFKSESVNPPVSSKRESEIDQFTSKPRSPSIPVDSASDPKPSTKKRTTNIGIGD